MIIQVEKLTKEYKAKERVSFWRDLFAAKYYPVRAVDAISFGIEKGESVALLGPNGSGKTTTMKMLSGLIFPTSGKVTVLGFTPFDRKTDYLMRIGLVMGNKTGLDWDLTPRQSFELTRKIYRITDKNFSDRVSQLTQMLEVTGFMDTQVRRLSLGERMKLELIGAILHNPEVLFLDEPTIGLDVISKQKIRDFLRYVQQTYGVTLLLTSHDMDDIEKVCDRVIVINKGKKVFDDSLPELTKKYNKDRYVKFVFEDSVKDEDFSKIGAIVEKTENYVVFKTKPSDVPVLLEKVTKKYSLIDVEIHSTPLDDVIADIYRGSK
jgi:ABC-2 type transport system ATP-binding protein